MGNMITKLHCERYSDIQSESQAMCKLAIDEIVLWL